MLRKLLPERGLMTLMLLYVLAELLVWPSGNFPLNDDWAFARTVQTLANTGRFELGSWPAMTLWTHVIYGLLFVYLFGFSFNILRVSTLLSSFVGAVLLYRLLKRFSGSSYVAFAGSALFVFHPVYFSSSNSFMTEINFSTLLILGIYLGVRYFESDRLVFILPLFIVSVLITMLRQFGLVLPAAFALAVFVSRRGWIACAAALGSLCVTYVVLKAYEGFIVPTLPESHLYQPSGNIHPDSREFYVKLGTSLQKHFASIVLHALVFLAPIASIRIPTALRVVRPLLTVLIFLFSAAVSYYGFNGVRFPAGNVFINMSVGAPTFYQDLTCGEAYNCHTWSTGFEYFLQAVRLIFPAISLFVLTLTIIKTVKQREFAKVPDISIFVWVTLVSYLLLLMIADNYFDRYNIPVYAMVAILFSRISRSFQAPQNKGYRYFAFAVVAVYFVISVAGTHDYFTINRIRWEAYSYVHNETSLNSERIHAGFEPKGWNDGREYLVLYDFNWIEGNDYLVQFKAEPGFTPVRSYPFIRCFPPRQDTIFIFTKTP